MRRLADAASRRLQASWWRARPDTLAHALAPLSRLYSALLKNRRRKVPAQDAGVPVIVVGNLIVGGAGKTPTVIAVVKLLRRAGWTPGVVSRGYGGSSSQPRLVHPTTPAHECGDEPLLIRLRTGVPVAVGRNRVTAAGLLREAVPEVDVIISDDGLQHWRMARDVQVIVFDDRGAGNGLLLPAGPLREPLPSQLPPGSFVLYNASAPSTALPGWMARRDLSGVCSLADWWSGGATQPLEVLRGRLLHAAAGVADPERFFRMLEAKQLTIVRWPLRDHHDFSNVPWPPDACDVVVTEKDAVKLRPERAGTANVWVAALDFEPDPAFNAALLRALFKR